MKAGIDRTKMYTLEFLHLGFFAVCIYLLSVFLRILSGKLYIKISDRFPVLTITQAGSFLSTLADLPVLWEVFCKKIYRLSTKRDFDVVIDAGAHIGAFTIYVGTLCPKAKIIAVEPHPLSRRLLNLNLRLNKMTGVLSLPFALSSASCNHAKLYTEPWRGESTIKSERARSRDYLEVSTLTLDKLTKGLAKVGLIKIDVEGAELDVLKGGKKTLAKTRELVIASYHYPTEADEVEGFLRKHGFNTRRYSAGGGVYVYAFNPLYA